MTKSFMVDRERHVRLVGNWAILVRSSIKDGVDILVVVPNISN